MNVKGKVAVVTGAGSGIGRGISLSLAKRGCHLVLVDNNSQGLDETVQMLSAYAVRVQKYNLDLRCKEAINTLAETVANSIGGADLLINNAGIAASGTFLQMSEETFDHVLAVNFGAVVQMTRSFLPQLLQKPEACIVNISSVYGLISPVEQTAYSASKFAVRGFSNALRHELEATNVKVTVVHPGGVATGIAKAALHPPGKTGLEIEEGLLQSEKFLRMPPGKAGEIIVRGIIKGKARLLVGTDAKLLSFIERLMPVHYWNLLKRLAKRTERL